MTKEYDFIIVGQGLAGTCLSYHLIMQGKRVLVFDDPLMPSSSVVAGGIFNPITGRNMILTWKAHMLFDFLISFYRSLENLLSIQFLHVLPLYHPFSNQKEQTRWLSEGQEPKYAGFIEKIVDIPSSAVGIDDPLGGIFLGKSGYLEVPVLLKSYSQFLQRKHLIVHEQFDLNFLQHKSGKVVYKDCTTSTVIFCQGALGFSSRYFDRVQFSPVKGEIIMVESEDLPDWIINKGIFMLPHQQYMEVGSTYNRDDNSWEPTLLARDWLTKKLKQLYHREFKVVDQKAGIRPAMADRRPVVGLLPDYPNIGIFNGLGTKGVTLAPYFAAQFANYLLQGDSLDKEVSLNRFFD